ncbi:ankyrin repeat and LEM domain-containing protein 1 isoform X1 [Loxodonta africana]|uniref:ankyrin repeat and LEM domain-containing protein 1 isoform X1 n=1 Tax=Loxodonta africana TaxID=9785 RepID=UPI0030D17B58
MPPSSLIHCLSPTPGPEENGLRTSLSVPPNVTLDSTVLQTQLGIGDGRDLGLEAAPGQPNLPEPQEAANQNHSLEAPLGLWDYSSEASFVTAVEASGAEDSAPDSPPWARSLPHTMQGLLPGVWPPQRVPRSLSASPLAHRAIMGNREAELNSHLQALTLSSTDADDSASSSSTSSTPCPAQNPLWEPPLGPPDLYFLTDDQTSLDSDVAALWLTEDEEQSTDGRDPVPTCWHPPVPAVSDLELLWQLRVHGESPGPITPFTRPYYLQRLEEAKAGPGPNLAGHSPELAEALRTGRIPDAQAEEDALAQQFEQPDPARRWREGIVKSSFTYLLLDPRETQDLPGRAFLLTPAERLQTFVRAIFYVGKGTRARPDAHLWEAIGQRGRPGKQVWGSGSGFLQRQPCTGRERKEGIGRLTHDPIPTLGPQACAKVRRILDIWASDRGVISLHCFQHVVAAEAYTREACLVDALGIQTLTNQKQGHCYGVVASWPPARRRRLGVHLLHRALLVFLAEGERELRPQDIQARG